MYTTFDMIKPRFTFISIHHQNLFSSYDKSPQIVRAMPDEGPGVQYTGSQGKDMQGKFTIHIDRHQGQ